MVSIPHFLEYVNANDVNLRFIGTFSRTSVNFLDLTLEGKTETGKVMTSIYRKPYAGNTILHAKSSHPKHIIRAIPYGEHVRTKRTCSDSRTLTNKLDEL